MKDIAGTYVIDGMAVELTPWAATPDGAWARRWLHKGATRASTAARVAVHTETRAPDARVLDVSALMAAADEALMQKYPQLRPAPPALMWRSTDPRLENPVPERIIVLMPRGHAFTSGTREWHAREIWPEGFRWIAVPAVEA